MLEQPLPRHTSMKDDSSSPKQQTRSRHALPNTARPKCQSIHGRTPLEGTPPHIDEVKVAVCLLAHFVLPNAGAHSGLLVTTCAKLHATRPAAQAMPEGLMGD